MPKVTAAIQDLHKAIGSIQVALVRGAVDPALLNRLGLIHEQIQSIPGVPPLPGPMTDVHELVGWVVPALGALRAEQTRRSRN